MSIFKYLIKHLIGHLKIRLCMALFNTTQNHTSPVACGPWDHETLKHWDPGTLGPWTLELWNFITPPPKSFTWLLPTPPPTSLTSAWQLWRNERVHSLQKVLRWMAWVVIQLAQVVIQKLQSLLQAPVLGLWNFERKTLRLSFLQLTWRWPGPANDNIY